MTAHKPLSADQKSIRARCFHPAGDFIEFSKQETDQSILNRFAEIVRKHPDRVALKTRSHELTYAELDNAANRVALALLEFPERNGGPVGLLFENGAPFVIASLGVLKAGKIQMSLESTFPKRRLDYLLEQSEAAVLVTDNANLAVAQSLRALPLINIDTLYRSSSISAPALNSRPDVAVVIDYTSGSTGPPKGMVWNQRGLLHVVARHTNASHICMHDRLVMFRASVRAYLSILLNGGTFYPMDLRHEEASELGKWLMKEEITIYRAAVSTFRSLAHVLTRTENFPCLRLILLFGEPAYRRDVDVYRRHFADHCIFASSLGCNEMDDFAYFFIDKNISLPGEVLPAGYPAEDVEILLLDENERRVGGDQIGEISVRSHYNPLGYWRQPDLTRLAFVTDPDGSNTSVYRTGDIGRLDTNGRVFHLGRKDFQIKIRGYRVDVAAVEAALLQIEGITEAVVVGWEDNAGDKRLIAYVVPEGAHMPRVSELRRVLRRDLPEYSVPSTFLILDSIPLTATGKVDRRGLPPPGGTRPQLESPFVAPRTPVEESLAAIWAEVLNLNEIGVLDNFLELGGDSLRATRVIARVMTRFQVRPTLRALLEAPTVAEMALVILENRAGSMDEPKVDQLLSELDALSEEEARSLLSEPDIQTRISP